MARGWFGQRMPDRLRTWPTADELARMVRHPAAYGPTAAEVLTPDPAPLPLTELADFGARDVVLRDGDVVGLSLAGRSFVAHSDSIFTVAPKLEAVRFVAVRHILGELVWCPNLSRLRTLDLSGNRIGPVGATLVAGCPHLDGLHTLDLTANSIADAGVSALVAANWGDSIEELRLSSQELSSDTQQLIRVRFGNRVRLT